MKEMPAVGRNVGSPLVAGDLVNMLRAALAHGDVESAVRLYEQSGGTAAQVLMDALDALGETEKLSVAQLFSLARDFGHAAMVFTKLGRHGDAAALYEQSGEYVLAARAHQAAGNLLAAGAAYERGGKAQAALEVYAQAGAHDAAAHCLVRERRFFDAATLYRNLGNTQGEVDMLYRVPVASPQRPFAVLRLSELLEQFGHVDQAVQLMTETVAQNAGARVDVAFNQRLVHLCEVGGQAELAAQARAHVQALQSGTGPAPMTAPLSQSQEMRALLEPHNAQAAERLESRRKRRSTAPELQSASVAQVDPFADLLARDPAMASAYQHLKQLPFFAELSLPDMQAIYRICIHVSYPAEAVIIEQGAGGSGLLVVLQGSVHVLRVGGAAPVHLATLGPGESLGEMSIVDALPTSARVVAATPVSALFMPRDALSEYLATHDSAALRIFRVLTRTLVERLRAANLRG
ncbi:MAG: cyclic nucleotide-binding domain-containing protein [Myxococcota bacterium]